MPDARPADQPPLSPHGDELAEAWRRARVAAALFLVVHPLYTLLELAAAAFVALPAFVHRELLATSGLVNLGLDAVVAAFLLWARRAPGRRWDTPRGLHGAGALTTLLLLAGWGVHLHLGGSQSSHVLPLVLGTLATVAWFLPIRLVIGLAVAGSAWLGLLVGLEVAGVLPYAPLLDLGAQATAIYRDGHVVSLNAVIYVCSVGLPVAVLVLLRADLAASRRALAARNHELQAEVARRERAETTLRRAAEELRLANQDLRGALRGTAHDLRSPLTAIGGYAWLIRERTGLDSDRDVREHAQRIQRGTEYMEHLLDDLSSVVLGGGGNVALQRCDVAAVLDRVLDVLDLELQQSGAVVERGELPQVLADADLLARVLQNLVGNALKFRGERPPRVRVDASRDGDRWVVAVRDDGIGFEAGNAERIFEPFVRLAPRERFRGSGIGLAVCRTALERMGGRIWAEGRPGAGATFRVSLGAVDGDGAGAGPDARDGAQHDAPPDGVAADVAPPTAGAAATAGAGR